MATLRDIRRRIRTVQKTRQITSAMRMVSAAKLRRSQDLILAARPYGARLWAAIGDIGRRQKGLDHPLLRAHPERRRAELLVITSDRGLAGAYNANTLKRAEKELERLRAEDLVEISVSAVGRKAQEYFRRRRALAAYWPAGASVEVTQAQEIGAYLIRRYEAGEIDEAWVVGSEFVSALTQTPRAFRLLPFVPLVSPLRSWTEDAAQAPFHVEPNERRVLDTLVPVAFEFSLYVALLENQAGEHAARMTAMEAATRNTEELIGALTLRYNRARQAAITKELVEIVSGAEALA